MKISFLLHNRYGIGGVIQSTLNLAEALAETYTVEIVSTRRDRDRPSLPLSSAVEVIDLVDTRKTSYAYDGKNPAFTTAPLVYPEGDKARYQDVSRLTEIRLGEYLARTDADVVVATNPGIAVCLASMGSRERIRIAQEHQALASPNSPLGQRLTEAYREMDAVITVNPDDARKAQLAFGHAGTRIETIPNCLPATSLAPSDLGSKTVVAAGRLAPVKRFHELVRAFGHVAQERPDWQLRIFGVGAERGRVVDEINALGLSNHVYLMGSSSRMDVEWAKASLAVSSSQAEAFSLVIVEAGRAGVPTVSTACDGPRSIIRHGHDGLLTPKGDPEALADAMLQLINDDELRARMGTNALDIPQRYAPEAIARSYVDLFGQLHADQALPDTADWWTDERGDVVVRVAAPDLATDALRLLCVSSDGFAPEPTVSLPFTRVEDRPGAPLLCRIRRDALPLTEGVWELYAEAADGRARRRLHTGSCDNRTLMSVRHQDAAPGQPALVSLLPYSGTGETVDLRVWVRGSHAEVVSVETDGAEGSESLVTVDVRSPEPLPERLAVVAQSRHGGSLDFELPVRSRTGSRLTFALPFDEFGRRHTTGHDVWDLYVSSESTPPIRVAGLTGDCVNRKAVYRYQSVLLERTPRGRARTRPYYTVANELSVNVVDLRERSGDSARGMGRLRRRLRRNDEPEAALAPVPVRAEEPADALPREELIELCTTREAQLDEMESRYDAAAQALKQAAAELARLGDDLRGSGDETGSPIPAHHK
ncbi:glycosyltransferase family 4 protein [Streptomyces sp. NPDC050504]|uniref:glycosyltransferase family 4 protein n=1 Tax=Streptomyces sp. NPDC050504 TaxID=3365618 RepID=UPI0037A36117